MAIRSDRLLINYSINFFSSIVVVFLGKWFFRHYPISGLTLTISNSLISAILATIVLKFSVNPHHTKPSTILSHAPKALTFAIYLVFSNFSLQYNTLLTYQLFKVQVPLALMLFEILQSVFLCNSTLITDEKLLHDYPIVTVLSFLIILFGSVWSIYHDIYLNLWGLFSGFVSIFLNALHQNNIQIESLPTIYDRIRFLKIVSTLSIVFLAPIWPFVDQTFEFNYYLVQRWKPVLSLTICGLAGFLLNSSSICCIKEENTIRFNVIGQLKTVFIISFGSIIFGEKIYYNQIIGLCFMALGCLIYTLMNFSKRNSARNSEQQLT